MTHILQKLRDDVAGMRHHVTVNNRIGVYQSEVLSLIDAAIAAMTPAKDQAPKKKADLVEKEHKLARNEKKLIILTWVYGVIGILIAVVLALGMIFT